MAHYTDLTKDFLKAIEESQALDIEGFDEIIVVFGETGAGKSTIINMLTKVPMAIVPVPDTNLFCFVLQSELSDEEKNTTIINSSSNPSVSMKVSGSSVSETLAPKVTSCSKTVGLVDLAGIFDNRGVNIEIRNACGILTFLA